MAGIEKEIKNYKKPFIVFAPTGAGKSILISETARRLGGKVLVLQPNVELLKQNAEKLKTWADVKVYSASAGKKELGDIVVGTLGSVKNDPDFRHYDHLIIDEVDAGYGIEKASSQFLKFVSDCNFKTVIGFTATPYRMITRVDKRSWTSSSQIMMMNRIPTKNKGFFWGKIVSVDVDLVKQGYLTPVKYFAEKPQDSMLTINSTGSDFTKESLEEYGDANINRACEIVRGILTHTTSKKVLVFVPSVESAYTGLRIAQKAGISGAVVEGSMSKKERTKAIDGFKSGDLQVLFNVNVLTAGYDDPELDAIVMARPTLSVRLYQQIVGRLVRTAEGKDYGNFYDISGTCLTFGRADKIKLGKEDGFKDMLYGENGRLDMRVLARYRLPTKTSDKGIRL